MLKCEICGVKLRRGRWYEPLLKLFILVKDPVPMLVMNIQDLKTDIIFVCKEDREWIRNNPDGAEAILRSKLF